MHAAAASRARIISGWITAFCGGGQPLPQIVLAVFVHQEADGAAVHAVDRLAGVHELVQGLQHQAVAAQRDDDVGLLAASHRRSGGPARPRAVSASAVAARHEGDAVTGAHGRQGVSVGAAARRPKMGSGMDRAVFVYTTYPSVVEAETAGKTLVEARLAACVNILPGMISHYRWQGAVERGEEAVMLVKTRASLAEPVRAAVKASHPYDTPAILVLPIESVDETYFAWIMAFDEA